MLLLLLIGLVVGMAGGPSIAFAQSRDRIKISNIRVGLPPGPGSNSDKRGIFKRGEWTPVYADFECVRDTEEELLLSAETVDADQIMTSGTVKMAPMVQGERRMGIELGRIPYLKITGRSLNVAIKVAGVSSERIYSLSNSHMNEPVLNGSFVVLSIGGSFNSFKLTDPDGQDGEVKNSEIRRGWVNTSQIVEVSQMPDQWIGYSAVDLMVLSTGANRAFWEELSAPQHDKRRKAITEWVRRGGKVVVSLGTNVDSFANIREFKEMLPASIPAAGKTNVTELAFKWKLAVQKENVLLRHMDAKAEFASAIIEPLPNRSALTVIREYIANGQKEGRPLGIQGPYGVGRVTVFAFDVDRSPFADFPERAAFWENTIQQCGFMLPQAGSNLESNSRNFDEHCDKLFGNLDYFEGVPVVSFGWVALFILLYILLIGPIDYFFLKKVVRKLEWTWVTFPIIVIVVSTAAYFTAYAIKGNELKTNKIDVVDYDLQTGRIDGHSWFTLFSPRIEKYTIGIEPAVSDENSPDPSWTYGKSPEAALPSVLSWAAVANNNQQGSGSLFTKKYEYQSTIDPTDPNRDLYASSLINVPIQVWTTKSFSARWTSSVNPKSPPVIANLTVSAGNPNVLTGTISNKLPVENFSDIALVWRGKVFQLLDFPRDVTKPVTVTTVTGDGDANTAREFKGWLNDGVRYAGAIETNSSRYNYSRNSDYGTTSNPHFRIWSLLFHEVAYDADVRTGKSANASMRELDQSWRTGNGHSEQAVLLLRIPTIQGAAEEITRSPNSPSRLWIGSTPTDGGQRPANPGNLRQETYVRVFIPVKTTR